MSKSYTIKGLDKVLGDVKNLASLPIMLDPVYRRNALFSLRQLIVKTPKMTGTIARQWQTPQKLGNSFYSIKNEAQTRDKKHSLIAILDEGRGPIYPKKAKMLYIPLTNKGRAKALGAAPTGLTYGVDYVYANKAGPSEGKNFIEPIVKETENRIAAESLTLMR